AADEIAPLTPGATYRIYTPFGNDAIAQRMLELLEAEKAKDNPADTAG
ncbi:MAG: hypothetical protein IT324_01390, partial [Anaerolineae bacterium]|nr:hypothetical protein [Anaerolineae bacterium]